MSYQKKEILKKNRTRLRICINHLINIEKAPREALKAVDLNDIIDKYLIQA